MSNKTRHTLKNKLPAKKKLSGVISKTKGQAAEEPENADQAAEEPEVSAGKVVHHFTLLVLSKSDESFSVRYYESLKTPKAAAKDFAQKLLRNFFGMVEDVPERCNKSFQSNVECAFHVMHHMEDEMRRMLGPEQR